MLKINYMRTEDIVPYDKNPRQNQEAIDMVAMSIKEYGFKNPVIVDKENIIIAGHTRMKAAEQLGIEEIPVIKAEDLTPEQVKAFRIADNKTAEFSEWDFNLLAQELDDLDLEGFDLELTGFDRGEIGDIMSKNDDEIEPEEDDYIEDIPEDPITRPGDIWLLGNHKLICGDSTSKETIEKLLAGEEIDLTITDPPYNVAYEGQNGMTIQNDDMADEEFGNFLDQVHQRIYEVSKEGAPVYIFHADSVGHQFRQAFIDSGLLLKQCLIWVKNSLVLGRQDYHWKHEPVLYGWKPGAAHKWYGQRDKDTVIEDYTNININQLKKEELKELATKLMDQLEEQKEHTTIIRANKPLSNDLHPTMKPIPLIGKLMKNSSIKRNIIFEPFGGSGSTLIAAEQLGRYCRAIELDERYADVIVDRYIKFKGTAEEVYLIRDGIQIPFNEIEQ